MSKIFLGIIIGIVLATVGLKGVGQGLQKVAPVVDKNVEEFKSSVKEQLNK